MGESLEPAKGWDVTITIDPGESKAQLKIDLRLNPHPIGKTEDQATGVHIKHDPRRPQRARRSSRLSEFNYE